MDRQGLGQRGEALAVEYLRQKGYQIVARNYRRPFGEIDIIARDGAVLVFVEVKARRSARFGGPFEAVDGRKQRQLIRVAQAFLSSGSGLDSAARFDVIGIFFDHDPPTIHHIVNAFDVVSTP